MGSHGLGMHKAYTTMFYATHLSVLVGAILPRQARVEVELRLHPPECFHGLYSIPELQAPAASIVAAAKILFMYTHYILHELSLTKW